MKSSALLHPFSRRIAAPTPPRVLVVDDDRDFRDAHAALIREQGCEVETAGDGEQALVMLAFNPYDLLVTDWQMPRLDGASLVHWLRATESTLPVVMITSANAAAELPAGIRREVKAVLPKPVPPGHLIAVLHRILRLDPVPESKHATIFDAATA